MQRLVPSIEEGIFQSVLSKIPDPQRAYVPKPVEANSLDWNLPGICRRARVGTSFGDLPVEALRVRDELVTSTGAIARVQKIDKLELDAEFLSLHPSAQPLRIAPNAVAPGKPAQELLVSPEQEVSSEMHIAGRFVKAVDLQGRFGALRVSPQGLTYYRFHCGEPVSIRVEGVWLRVRPW